MQSPAAGVSKTNQPKITPLMQFLHDKHALKPEKRAAILVPIKKVCSFCLGLMHLMSTNMFPGTSQVLYKRRQAVPAAYSVQLNQAAAQTSAA